MKKYWEIYTDFFIRNEVSLIDLQKWTDEGYVLSDYTQSILESNPLWDVEIKLIGSLDDAIIVIHRPKGFNPEEAEDNPFGDDLDDDDYEDDEEDSVRWN